MASKSKAVEPIVEEELQAPKAEPVVEEAPKPEVKAPVESVYSAAELANNHKVFKTSREIVSVALRLAGKESATLTEATNIIENFKNKEVK